MVCLLHLPLDYFILFSLIHRSFFCFPVNWVGLKVKKTFQNLLLFWRFPSQYESALIFGFHFKSKWQKVLDIVNVSNVKNILHRRRWSSAWRLWDPINLMQIFLPTSNLGPIAPFFNALFNSLHTIIKVYRVSDFCIIDKGWNM